jgi:hypothetical protein
MAYALRTDVDWEAIEHEYRSSQLSTHQIGALHAISHTMVVRRAKRLGWTRNLAGRVRTAVKAALVIDPLNDPLIDRRQAPEAPLAPLDTYPATRPDTPMTLEEQERVVETAAARAVMVVRSHRRDIAQARMLVRTLMSELMDTSRYGGQLEEAVLEETAADRNNQRRAAMLRAVSLPARATMIRDLSTAMSKLVALERQAFNLDAELPDDGKPVRDAVHDAKLQHIYDMLARRAGSAAAPPASVARPVLDQPMRERPFAMAEPDKLLSAPRFD